MNTWDQFAEHKCSAEQWLGTTGLEERVFLLLLLQEVRGLFSTDVYVPTKTEILSLKAALHKLKRAFEILWFRKQ